MEAMRSSALSCCVNTQPCGRAISTECDRHLVRFNTNHRPGSIEDEAKSEGEDAFHGESERADR